MVDFGLPEMAYYQAQTLTTLQVNNGLAWGVVAYVDARRAQMAEAIYAINLAGQFAPDNKFVQHTAGELVAWYDLKADKATIPWWWWQPCGFWGGCAFFPFGVSFAFCGSDDFGYLHHDGFRDHDGHAGHEHDPGSWHHDPQGRNSFFGTPARPSASVTGWARAGSQPRSPSAPSAASAGAHWWTGTGQHSSFAAVGTGAGALQPHWNGALSTVPRSSVDLQSPYARHPLSAPGLAVPAPTRPRRRPV